MSDIKPSQGAWESREQGQANFYTISADGNWLMSVYINGEKHTVEQKKIMKLIVASPKLREGLKILLTAVNDKDPDPVIVFAAIEKAKAALESAEDEC